MSTIDANSIHREKGLDHLRKVFDAGEVEIVPQPNGAAPTSETRALDFINASTWAGQTPKKRRWLASTRIPRATVTMLTGDGAAGKTTIGLQLGVATIRGTDWLGAVIEEHGPVIFFSAEEDSDEVHRRLDAIVAHHGIDMNALDKLHILCMPGEDAVLGAADRSGVVKATPLFEALERRAIEIKPALIIIEAAADVFAGNENDRSQVRQFIGILRRLAIKSDAAVLLIAHPSLTGMASGTGTSGSTGWNNSVRSRLYFSGAKARDGDDADPDIRELKVMKSNYGPAGEVVRLRWQRGVFVPEGGAGGIERIAVEAAIDEVYLDCLDAAHWQWARYQPAPEQYIRADDF